MFSTGDTPFFISLLSSVLREVQSSITNSNIQAPLVLSNSNVRIQANTGTIVVLFSYNNVVDKK